MRDSLEAILSTDFTTTSAGSIAGAVKILSSQTFDVVITDFNLEDGTGLTIIETSRLRCPSASTIMLTGHMDYAEVRALQKSGRILVLFKPVNPDELLAWVKNGVTMSRLSAATRRLTARGGSKDAPATPSPDSPSGGAKTPSGRVSVEPPSPHGSQPRE